jgi:hypothetical protein
MMASMGEMVSKTVSRWLMAFSITRASAKASKMVVQIEMAAKI